MKAAVVERFNRTFQNNYYKILMMYPKKLKRVVVSIVSKNYNLTPHSVTVFIPLDVNKDNSVTVKFSNEQLDQRDVINKLQKFYVRSYTFEVGDKVRLSHDKMVFFFERNIEERLAKTFSKLFLVLEDHQTGILIYIR